MSKIKIFSIYYSKENLFHGKAIKTDIIEPIQTGKAATGWDLGMLADDTGDNISEKNPYYGELTCWYWVWKNWIPKHPECEYIGFTQYRRMLQLGRDKIPSRKVKENFLVLEYKHSFINRCSNIREDDVQHFFLSSDMIIPYKWISRDSKPSKHIQIWHKSVNYEILREIVLKGDNPNEFDSIMNESGGYYKCNFIMRVDLFIKYVQWVFSIISQYEIRKKQIPLAVIDKREYAFIIEHITNCWINIMRLDGARITERLLLEAVFYKQLRQSTKAFKNKVKEYAQQGVNYFDLFQ